MLLTETDALCSLVIPRDELMGQNFLHSRSQLPPRRKYYVYQSLDLVVIFIQGGERRKLKWTCRITLWFPGTSWKPPGSLWWGTPAGGELMADLCVSVLLCCDWYQHSSINNFVRCSEESASGLVSPVSCSMIYDSLDQVTFQVPKQNMEHVGGSSVCPEFPGFNFLFLTC